MGFLGSIFKVGVKTVLTPVAIVDDVVKVINDEETSTTANLIESIEDDLDEAIDDLDE